VKGKIKTERRGIESRQVLKDGKVSRATDRQKLSQSLQEP